MSAYRTASRLSPSSHVPLLYIGMEYLRTNNLSLAQHFLRAACQLCASDPLLYNEMGVAYYRYVRP
jgi:anaphase-promoting complex subunit 6